MTSSQPVPTRHLWPETNAHRGYSRGIGAFFSLALALGAVACSSSETPAPEPADDVVPDVPVPPANGPQLLITEHQLVVRDRPSSTGTVLGTLAAGARVARADKAYSQKGCPGGWYPIRPRGFVCAGPGATTDLNAPAGKVLAPPQLDKPLPYRYARVARGAAISYSAVPSAEEQAAAEPKRRTARPSKMPHLGAGANDVPLNDKGLAAGPPVLLPDAAGVGVDGYRTHASYFAFPGGATLEVGSALGPVAQAKTRVFKRRSGIALTNSVDAAGRRLGVMPDGRLIPADRLQPALGSAWHGHDISEAGLPVAFSLRAGVRAWHLKKGKATQLEEEYEPHHAIALTGRYRTVNRQRYLFGRDDTWYRHKDLILINKRSKFPEWATADQKWLDISLANQTLVAWQGRKPLYATLISSGQDRLGDPATGPATTQGVFRLLGKHVTRSVDSREVNQAYTIGDAPWVLDFAEGFAITGCYWHDRFGEALSYHNIAMAPIDARWLWQWAGPAIPDGWHSAVIAEDAADNTIVYIHK